jgi:predicted Na+-dependent transporter
MLLFESYFRDDFPLAVVPLAVYHFGQLVVDTFIADYWAASALTRDGAAIPSPSGVA